MATPLLGVTRLDAGYGDSQVLRSVSFTLAEGSALGLLGRNGMGKTTLIRSLLGFVRIGAGSITWRGEAIAGKAPESIARLGLAYVPEGRGIFPNLSVRENLVMAARKGPDGALDWTLEHVLATFPRLAERLAHGGQQLSGGEQQMLAIGRALMTNPRLLILDEATEGLAPLIVAEIWRVVGAIRATGISTLIVDRDFRKVLAHTDRALVLEKGCVVMDGDSATLAPDELARRLGV
jgi:branched-chain amino acid transport system ATP-binding protein